ncbi:phosphotransferase family protein [Radiobacillus deserti]|uniref:Aminoglycoside phosphotransferase family protein n=1 Tax=Radiobacillus deserti TaxID=2594883 RepID=A0A516KJN4_9BACI|nr:aminoglycoside phosphotransferase family protein [Radiobacillus deserti]QDP41579.1 aminoglycoside phosphotransferase family protein [Radiobacillus deserti]
MKAGWERSNELIIPTMEIVRNILKPFLKEKVVLHIQPLSGGLNNSNIKITTDTNESFVLRIYSKNSKSIEIERKILNLVKDKVPVPQVLYIDSSCSVLKHPFLILSWVNGTQLSEVMSEKSPKNTSSIGNAVGKALSQIHKVKFAEPGFFDEELKITQNVKLNADTFLMYIEESLLLGYGNKHIGMELCNEVLRFSKEKSHLINNLEEQNSLVHSDFNPLNILVEDRDRTINISGILDWEYAFSGCPLMDIANFLRYEKVSSPELLNEFIVSYKGNGGILPDKWLQKAKLLDLISLCGLLNRKIIGEVRVKDIKRLILNTIDEWESYETIEKVLV